MYVDHNNETYGKANFVLITKKTHSDDERVFSIFYNANLPTSNGKGAGILIDN